MTGEPFGSGLPDESARWLRTAIIGLRAERSLLVERLDERVRRMWRDGLVREVEGLMGAGLGVTASRAIGYAQAIAQVRGELSEEQAIEQTAALTRKYARRQVGWFARYPATWFESDDAGRVESSLQLLLSDA